VLEVHWSHGKGDGLHHSHGMEVFGDVWVNYIVICIQTHNNLLAKCKPGLKDWPEIIPEGSLWVAGWGGACHLGCKVSPVCCITDKCPF